MRSTAGQQPTPKPLSAHVCTANSTPAIRRNDTWLQAAEQSRHSSERLRNHLDSIPTGDLFHAMWDGHVALARDAMSCEDYAIRGGALLHIGVAKAAQRAAANTKARGVAA